MRTQKTFMHNTFAYFASKETMRAYDGNKYLEQWKKNPGKTFEGKWEAFIQPKLDGNRCCFDVKNKKMYSNSGKEFDVPSQFLQDLESMSLSNI